MVGKRTRHFSAPNCSRVQPDVLGAGLAHAPQDRLGDHVARREVGQFVLAVHEPDAGVVDQERALAAHRLADQWLLPAGPWPEPGHGRMELDELQVAQHRARPAARPRRRRRSTRSGWSSTRRPGRCRRWRARRPVRALRRRRRAGPRPSRAGSARRSVRRRSRSRSSTSGVLDHLDAAGVEHPGDERALDLRAGRVAAGVRDAVAVVTALAGQRQLAVGGAVEPGARAEPARAPRPGPRAPARRTAASSQTPAPATHRVRGSAGRASPRRRARRRCRPAPTGSSRRPSTSLVTSRTRSAQCSADVAARRSGRRCPSRRPRRRSRSASPGAEPASRVGSSLTARTATLSMSRVPPTCAATSNRAGAVRQATSAEVGPRSSR